MNTATTGVSAGSVFAQVGDAVLLIAALCAAVAILSFMWGAVVYLTSYRNEEERQPGRRRMVWGTEALIILFILWLIVHWLALYFGGGR